MAVGARLKYLIRGVEPDRGDRGALQAELEAALPGASAITLLPVVEGFSLDLEMHDIAPFSRTSFEPYVAEHVLPDAVRLRCQARGDLGVQLLKASFN